ncbi:3-oxoacyl-[acyl-carrier protein] reductase [Bacillus sp. JCM 19045]|uniref:3-oxoacyl-[acyl-carrier-protein] reductase n=1 Tax=Shouchella xiaoxiensis TaxID=766895 RepID=A0ABS2SSX7_9BACI|nr:3-oxoacyl-[acyl-carrier-protein] reductase [Shouchella xiaoxiensis]MBM7837609.1 3-oxoacyl-[acyl-carrier protein] reductase [Shouchella xiaoxiensis]GAF12838.1 3-oxoacyl-[acyl-carrier protein] reductase [Bacillus sp. JCM 19045]
MLANQTAIVTGASRGIGRAIALELAAKGANIVINYAGNQAKAEEVVAQVKELGSEAFAYQADVANSDDVQAMMKETISRFGSIDILVNNAGITKDNLLMRMKEQDWDDVIDTNLKGVFLCAKAVSRQMMKQRSGRIINVASVVGVLGNPGQANYVAAKAGVIGLTKSLAREFASRNVLVNAIAPGFISTDMTDELDSTAKEALLTQIPLGKLGEPEHVANVVRFLASDDAAYMTGQTIHIDGGMVMP